jgi:hypothetical protein
MGAMRDACVKRENRLRQASRLRRGFRLRYSYGGQDGGQDGETSRCGAAGRRGIAALSACVIHGFEGCNHWLARKKYFVVYAVLRLAWVGTGWRTVGKRLADGWQKVGAKMAHRSRRPGKLSGSIQSTGAFAPAD